MIEFSRAKKKQLVLCFYRCRELKGDRVFIHVLPRFFVLAKYLKRHLDKINKTKSIHWTVKHPQL